VLHYVRMTFPEHDPPSPDSPTPIEEPPARESSRGPVRGAIVAGLLVVALAAFGGAALSHLLWPSTNTSSTPLSGFAPGGTALPSIPSQSGNGSGAGVPSASTASVASNIDPALVDINTITNDGEAAGTGMVITAAGEVITNNHVIAGATQISAYDVGNGRTYTAHVVGYDRSQDVAVLQLVDASGLATAPLGDSSTLRVGAGVVTVGNAGGVGGTPSAAGGSVAALNRSITAGDNYQPGNTERLKGVIQINGELQPGDSGGPLVSAGRVVGMDTAASSSFSFRSSAAGEGFAIPINEVLTISRQILAGQGSSVIHIGATALIGIYVSNTSTCASAGGGSGAKGALVCPVQGAPSGVIAGSPAASSGLGAFDTITELGGHPVTSAQSLLSVMDTHHPGDSVVLIWVDKSGASHSATVTLEAGPAD
jgi:S1-C subfamily serine protease